MFYNEWVFNIPELIEYWWDYTYNGNYRIAQYRFYPFGAI